MYGRRRLALGLLAILALTAGQAWAGVQYVIEISVDGLGGTYLNRLFNGTATGGPYSIPNFMRLKNEGTSTLAAHCDNNNWETLPNHVSIITARPRDSLNGLDGHNWSSNSDPAVGQTIHSNKGSYVASVFDVAHDNGLRTGMYANKSKFSLFDTYGSYTGGGSYNGTYGAIDNNPIGGDNGRDKIDNTYINTALGGTIVNTYITQQKSASPNQFAFLHINEPDAYGHSSGWGSATWNSQVVVVDTMIGNIFKLIEHDVPAMTGHTAIILTADHGNQDNPVTGADRYSVPFFVWGPGVTAGADLYTLNAGLRQATSSYPMTTYSGMQPIRNAEASNLALDLLNLGSIPGSAFNYAQNLVVSAPIISVIGAPGTPANWGTGTTWNLNHVVPGPDNEVKVRHSVNLAAATGPQTISLLGLDNANSDLRIAAGASLTSGNANVQNGVMTMYGALNTSTLAVSGGSATLAGGSSGTITNLNVSGTGSASVAAGSTAAITTVAVTGGTANVAGGSIGTLNASAGTTTLGTNVTALNVSGSASVLGGGGGAGTATLTGGTVDTQGNYLAIGNKVTLNKGMSISVAGATVDVKGAAGNNIGDASKISHLRLNGGTVIVFKPGTGPETLLWSEDFETNGEGAGNRYTSNAFGAGNTSHWGRTTASGPTGQLTPSKGSYQWSGVNTTGQPGWITDPGSPSQNGAWLKFNPLNVAGKTGLRLTFDVYSGIGTTIEDADRFIVKVIDVANGNAETALETWHGGSTATYWNDIVTGGDILSTLNAKLSKSLNISDMTGNLQLKFFLGDTTTSNNENIAFDNIKLYGRSIVATPIDLSATTLELTADSILDIGGATSASFFDLVLASGVTTSKTLRIAGTDWGGVSGLASFFDITAPNNANILQIGTDGSTYVDLKVPEPATMGLLALGGLALLRRRRKS